MRLRDIISFNLLVRLALAAGSPGGVGCTSCVEEKRLKDLERTAVVLLITGKEIGLNVACGVF